MVAGTVCHNTSDVQLHQLKANAMNAHHYIGDNLRCTERAGRLLLIRYLVDWGRNIYIHGIQIIGGGGDVWIFLDVLQTL